MPVTFFPNPYGGSYSPGNHEVNQELDFGGSSRSKAKGNRGLLFFDDLDLNHDHPVDFGALPYELSIPGLSWEAPMAEFVAAAS
eukprot:6773471-Pyramimonas_sp.AAC.1